MKLKRNLAACLSALLLLGCAACGNSQKEPTGILSPKEVTELESQYGLSQEELTEALRLSDADYTLYAEKFLEVMTLAEGREIGGQDFTPHCFISPQPEGFYAVRYRVEFDSPIGYDFFDSICEEAYQLYGEPRTPPYSDTPDTYRGANWRVGEQSFFRIMAHDVGVVEMTYQMIVPGSMYDY